MMKKLKSILYSATVIGTLLMATTSCNTKENVEYFQDAVTTYTEYPLDNSATLKLEPKDKLIIIVSAQDSRLSELFNLNVPNGLSISSSGSNESSIGYTIDDAGDIDFPVIGKIHIAGMTRSQAADYIKSKLIDLKMLKDPVVTVELANLSISVLGEVARPGKVRILKDKMTILDALAEAGDLTIYGVRENVLVLRKQGDKHVAYRVNLTSADDVYKSPVYYMQQDDVIYVTPNKTKANTSDLNANVVNSPSFWMSVASLLTTICVVIFR